MTDGLRVTLEDLDQPPVLCRKGCRVFFTRHGLDWSEMVKSGIPVERLSRIDDAMCREAIRRAEIRVANYGRQERR